MYLDLLEILNSSYCLALPPVDTLIGKPGASVVDHQTLPDKLLRNILQKFPLRYNLIYIKLWSNFNNLKYLRRVLCTSGQNFTLISLHISLKLLIKYSWLSSVLDNSAREEWHNILNYVLTITPLLLLHPVIRDPTTSSQFSLSAKIPLISFSSAVALNINFYEGWDYNYLFLARQEYLVIDIEREMFNFTRHFLPVSEDLSLVEIKGKWRGQQNCWSLRVDWIDKMTQF